MIPTTMNLEFYFSFLEMGKACLLLHAARCTRCIRSPDGLLGEAVVAVEKRQRIGSVEPPSDVAATGGGGGGGRRGVVGEVYEVVESVVGEPRGRGRDEAEDVLEEGLVAGEGEGAGVGREAVLLLGMAEQLPEDRVVEVRRPHHEPPGAAPHAHRHVPRRDVRCCPRPRPPAPPQRRQRRRPHPPPPQHLPQPNYVPDLAAFPHSSSSSSYTSHLSLLVAFPSSLRSYLSQERGRERSKWGRVGGFISGTTQDCP
ncbi:hypothetical protein B296_00021300 [Ensete ventricosum]|uniref:Uncharacterized protein n=1 Tax=Ensete ventricosum TaxID=4639 RepID=A0A427A584_ENSVE|nr:hypothetical protein B296_00021300 [Ensete ventricosum]